jgi:ribosomal protein L11 methyltransferase
MCLERLPKLPSGDALDVGCGSGLLGLAWARLGKGHVHAIDIDPRATDQTCASANASGLAELVTVECTRIETLSVAGRVASTILANVPSSVHLKLTDALTDHRPQVALISGIRPNERDAVLSAYRRLGLRRSAAARRGRWECHLLVSDRRDG